MKSFRTFPAHVLIHTAAFALLLVSSGRAQIAVGEQIGVDFSITQVAPNWTNVASFGDTIPALNLSSGATTGVTVSLDSFTDGVPYVAGGFDNLGGSAIGNFITTAPAAVTEDGAYSGANTLTLTFSGLNPLLTYTLEIFSVSRGYSTTPDTPLINGNVVAWSSGFESRDQRYGQTTGGIFSNLTTDSFGTLTFSIKDPGSNPLINGAVLSAIPEPSTYAAFAGAGALGLALWRRRRNRNHSV